jgi:hypothetical protein
VRHFHHFDEGAFSGGAGVVLVATRARGKQGGRSHDN